MASKAVLYPLLILFGLNVLSVALLAGTTYGFTQPTTISIGVGGISYQPASACNNPLQGIAILSNVFAFFSWIGGQIGSAFTGQANSCLAQAGAFVTYTYDPTSKGQNTFAITNFLVDLIPMALIAVAFAGVNIVGTGYNTGAVMMMVTGGGLIMAWAVLSGPVLAIFFVNSGPTAIPVQGLGLLIYAVLTLIFAIGAFGMMGGTKDL